MHFGLLFLRSSFLAAVAFVVVSGCGDDPAGARNPLGPSPAGMPSIGLSGTGAASGSLATSGTGAAGRSAAGAGVASIGAPGRAAAGSGMTGMLAPPAGGAGASASGGAPGVSAGTGAAGMNVAGMMAAAGTGTAGSIGQAGAGTGMTGKGACCADGDCLCHGPEPTQLSTRNGPFDTASLRISTGTVYYPTDAEPPFAAVGICGGFLNTGPEMESWGPMYASHGIVTVIVGTTGADIPEIRATKLLAAIAELKMLNQGSSGPLAGKLAGRYGTSGYSMGGGGTTLASGQDSSLKTSVGLAPWGGSGSRVQVATLLLCGDADAVAPCNMSQSVYGGIPDATPKMMITFRGATHFSWFGPGDAGGGASGAYALAFQKVFLEGDERWKKLLVMQPSSGTMVTNVK